MGSSVLDMVDHDLTWFGECLEEQRAVSAAALAPRDGGDEVEQRGVQIGDSVRTYLRDIGRIPMLSPAEEIALAIAIERGKAAAEELTLGHGRPLSVLLSVTHESGSTEAWRHGGGVGEENVAAPPGGARDRSGAGLSVMNSFSPGEPPDTNRASAADEKTASTSLRSEDEARLIELVRQADAARKRMIEGNLRLVVSIAKRYTSDHLGLLDLIEEGNIGLMRAVGKFDHHRGFKFSTYATWWIRQSITRALADHGRTVRLPVHVVGGLQKLTKVRSALQQGIGREPSHAELAHEMGVGVEKVAVLFHASRLPYSLHATVGDDDAELGDFVPDTASPSPEDEASRSLLKAQLAKALQSLTLRQRRVIQLRFGLEDGIDRTLEEVGRCMGITRERARQIESEAIARLRLTHVRAGLKDFLE